MKKRNGFTLVELFVVIALSALGATIALRALLVGGMLRVKKGNERAAVRTLHVIAISQERAMDYRVFDSDADGTPEYADSIASLMGMPEPGEVKTLDFGPDWTLSGYLFQIEPGDADTNEAGWVAWAWPIEYGVSGDRTFQIDPFGEILETDSQVFGPDGRQWPIGELAGKLKWKTLTRAD